MSAAPKIHDSAVNNSRLLRLYASSENNRSLWIAAGPEESVNNCFLKAGPYGNHIRVEQDGSLVCSKKIYPDDLLGLVATLLSSRADADKDVGVAHAHVLAAIAAMDARAVKRHGYSYSPEEKDVDASVFQATIEKGATKFWVPSA